MLEEKKKDDDDDEDANKNEFQSIQTSIKFF